MSVARLLRWELIVGGALVAGLGLATAPSANATAVTINPSALGISTQAPFTATNYTGADFATAIIQPDGSFIENGILQFGSFQNPSNPLGIAASRSGLNNGGGTGSYALFKTFAATGTIPGWSPAKIGNTTMDGTFSHVTYSFVVDPGNDDTFNWLATGPQLVDHMGNDIVLGGGSLFPPPNSVGVDNSGLPTAHVRTTLDLTAAGHLFFTSPPNIGFQEDAFTNTSGQFHFSINRATGVTTLVIGDIGLDDITGPGGMSGDFTTRAIPEPATLALVGTSLLGLGLARRKRRG